MNLQKIINDYRPYLKWLLGIMLYRFLSEDFEEKINEKERQEGLENFKPYSEWSGKKVDSLKATLCTDYGYFVSPNNLFKNVVKRLSEKYFAGDKYGIVKNALNEIFKPWKQSLYGYQFKDILKTINFENNELGLTEQQKTKKVIELFDIVKEMKFEKTNVKEHFEQVIEAAIQKIDEEIGGEKDPFVLSQEMMNFIFCLALNERDANQIYSVYDPDCNYGLFLLKFREFLGEAQLQIYGIENHENIYSFCLINLLINGVTKDEFKIKNIQNFHTNLKEQDLSLAFKEGKKYDIIFGNFLPLSDSKKRNNVHKFIDHCSLHLKNDGVAVILYFENAMHVHNADNKKVIEDLMAYKSIDCVISFQDKNMLYAKKVTKSLCVLVLKNRNNNSNRELLLINVEKNYPENFDPEVLQELYDAVIFRKQNVLKNYKHIIRTYEQLKDKDFSLSIKSYIKFVDSKIQNREDRINYVKIQSRLKERQEQIEQLSLDIDIKLKKVFDSNASIYNYFLWRE